jgi:hypothetical protein
MAIAIATATRVAGNKKGNGVGDKKGDGSGNKRAMVTKGNNIGNGYQHGKGLQKKGWQVLEGGDNEDDAKDTAVGMAQRTRTLALRLERGG